MGGLLTRLAFIHGMRTDDGSRAARTIERGLIGSRIDFVIEPKISKRTIGIHPDYFTIEQTRMALLRSAFSRP